MDQKKLVIIDGKSVFYRGYYAMGHLSRRDGTPTSGVYGFATIAMEIVRDLEPDKVVVAWDKARTSISKRKAIYADYKAGRVKPPEDFYEQIPLLRELVLALGWGFVECDDYEADDIIGTLSRQADEKGNWFTFIVSSDLDMLQIVDDNTVMYRLLKGFSDLEALDVPGVEQKYGIRKDQFLDLKALKGDSSDNIPGVPGIGEKGAAKLLNDYGDLDGIYAHIDEIKGATHDKLVAGKDSAYMSQKLAQIMFDAPVSLDEVPDLEINRDRIIAALKNLEFNSLIAKFAKVIDEKSGAVSETVEANPADVLEGFELYKDEVPEEIEINAEVPADTIVAANIKEIMHNSDSVAEQILSGKKFWDLAQAEFLLDPLKRVPEAPVQQSIFDLDPAAGEITEEARKQYALQIARYAKLPKLYQVLTEFDLPLIPVLYKMEHRGIQLDLEYFRELKSQYEKIVAELEQKIYQAAGKEFNVNSPIQLSEVLFTDLRLPTTGIKKTSRGYSTGAKELEKLVDQHEIIPLLMAYREAAKMLSTYITPLPELADQNGRIHTTFTQNVTATGRLSSVNPNLQNIPVRSEAGKRIRKGFVAAPGKVFVSADYAQFELRLAAVMSGDQKLIDNFNSGVDIHTKTASEVFQVPLEEVTPHQRRAAKVINFGVMYGMSPRGLAEASGMSFYEAKSFIDDYFKVRSPIKDFLDKTLKQAREQGYVETYFGRRRPTPDVMSKNFIIRNAAERAAQNMPIQGTEADLMKRVMLKVDKNLPEGAALVLQIHDSLVVECDAKLADQVAEVLQSTMESVAPELNVKLAVDVTKGNNLGELHD